MNSCYNFLVISLGFLGRQSTGNHNLVSPLIIVHNLLSAVWFKNGKFVHLALKSVLNGNEAIYSLYVFTLC